MSKTKEAELADIAQKLVDVLGARYVAEALGCRSHLPRKWLTQEVPVHPVYAQKLRVLSGLLARLSKAKSEGAAKQWLTTYHPELKRQPLDAIRYRQFKEAHTAATRFLKGEKS